MVTENKILNIVKVRYYSETTKEYSPREYTYFSENPLQVGDILTVPVRDTTGKAMVSAINVPDSEIEAFRDKVKTIPAGAAVKPELPIFGLAEAAQAAGAEVKEVNLFEQLPAIDIATEKLDVAIININPNANPALVSLREEIIKLSNYAIERVIKCDEDVSPATDDLALIAKLKKAIKEKQDEYVNPIKNHLEKVQFVFKDLLACLDDIDKENRAKITAYRTEQIRRQQEADELNRQALELAKKQAEFSGTGEITVDLTPLEAAPVLKRVNTDMGTMSTSKIWKWELEDLGKVPVEYLTIDAAKIGKVVRAGLRNIPGVRIYCEETLRVNTR